MYKLLDVGGGFDLYYGMFVLRVPNLVFLYCLLLELEPSKDSICIQ